MCHAFQWKLDEKKKKKFLVDLPRGALGKSEKNGLFAESLRPGSRQRACFKKNNNCFAESPPGGSRQRGFSRKQIHISLPRAPGRLSAKTFFQKKNRFLCRELGQVALGKSAVRPPTSITATFLYRELEFALGKTFTESPMNSSRQRPLSR